MKQIPLLSTELFGLFQEFFKRESGLYFEHGNDQPLCLALWERLQKRNLDSYRAYYELLLTTPDGQYELRALLDILTVGETFFFRSKAQFRALKEVVLPEIINHKLSIADKSIRIWSAGCSNGSEAYSIAITLMEALPTYEDWQISILGTDVNRNDLTTAREAVYGLHDISHLSTDYIAKYFEQRHKMYFLIDSVKKIPQFEYHNLAKDPCALDGMKNVDIIFCRNVIIYFDSETTQRIIDNFYNCLGQKGHLFLGYAETLWGVNDKFITVDFPETFFYKKEPLAILAESQVLPFPVEFDWEDFVNPDQFSFPAEGQKQPQQGRLLLDDQQQISQQPSIKAPDPLELVSLYSVAVTFIREYKYKEALESLDKIILLENTYVPAYLAKATIFANQTDYRDALKVLEKVIKIDNLCVEAYYLMGVLFTIAGNLEEAKCQFQRAIYVNPDIVLAHFNLANIYLFEKKFDKARLEFNNASKILVKRNSDETVKFCEDVTVALLLRACRVNIEKIDKKKRGGQDEKDFE